MVSVPRPQRAITSVTLGLLAGLISHFWATTQAKPRDFLAVWEPARALLQGQDPHQLAAGSFYPLPGLIAGVPWALITTPAAACGLFMALSAGAFAWALMENGYAPLIGFFAGGTYLAAEVVQWSPLFAGAYAMAPLALFFVVKPHIGVALWCARPSWWAVAGVLMFASVAFVLDPDWIGAWRSALAKGASLGIGTAAYAYSAPVLLPGGALACLALLRWRRPEARLLVALACVPQSLLLYETVPLALVPRGWKESVAFTALSHVVLAFLIHGNPWPTLLEKARLGGGMYTLLLYVPLTLMVLRRPNTGSVPIWIERRVASWPEWLRGRPAAAAQAPGGELFGERE